jgi:predicted RNA-binding Zn-ribbon protein involved in translation (DUF1610 family)
MKESDFPNDIHVTELVTRMESILATHPNAQLFVKWTCPNCGERVMSDDANVFHAGGYRHEECGFLYTGEWYGFLAAINLDGEDDER